MLGTQREHVRPGIERAPLQRVVLGAQQQLLQIRLVAGVPRNVLKQYALGTRDEERAAELIEIALHLTLLVSFGNRHLRCRHRRPTHA
jgi:hypothetical protein